MGIIVDISIINHQSRNQQMRILTIMLLITSLPALFATQCPFGQIECGDRGCMPPWACNAAKTLDAQSNRTQDSPCPPGQVSCPGLGCAPLLDCLAAAAENQTSQSNITGGDCPPGRINCPLLGCVPPLACIIINSTKSTDIEEEHHNGGDCPAGRVNCPPLGCVPPLGCMIIKSARNTLEKSKNLIHIDAPLCPRGMVPCGDGCKPSTDCSIKFQLILVFTSLYS
eukprot:TRINITY_DN101_c0_g1_i1.p1 TRINITY_DN101_c0_g1~~TRINITY_DN101_c0_g1_i1.p1  ORF type:complete len:226 (-),score=38.32 TRINITY_DN101_c0_g1_i1:118-795(-)